jgi:hypothetical protein
METPEGLGLMPTPARWYALAWFRDHETGGPDAVFGRKAPSARMRRLMVKQGEVERAPVGQFAYQKWTLTTLGHEVLGKKQTRRSRKPRVE